MNIKKIVLIFLIFIFVDTFPVFSESVSTYDVLVEENDEFIIKLSEGGLPNTRINEFITEMDLAIKTLQVPEKREEMEKYFLAFLFNYVLENEDYYDVCIVFDNVFQKEFEYMIENDMALPKTFERFFIVAMGDLILDETEKNEETYIPSVGPPMDDNIIEDENTNNEVYEETKNEEEKTKYAFEDLKGYEWANEYVKYLNEKDIISGYSNNTFNPGGYLTRAEGTKIVCKSFLKPGYVVLDSEYEDVTKDKW